MLTYDKAGACCASCLGVVVNGTLGGVETPGGTRGTVVVVSSAVNGVNVE